MGTVLLYFSCILASVLAVANFAVAQEGPNTCLRSSVIKDFADISAVNSEVFEVAKLVLVNDDLAGFCSEMISEIHPSMLGIESKYYPEFLKCGSFPLKAMPTIKTSCSNFQPWQLSLAAAEAPRKYAVDHMDFHHWGVEGTVGLSNLKKIKDFLAKPLPAAPLKAEGKYNTAADVIANGSYGEAAIERVRPLKVRLGLCTETLRLRALPVSGYRCAEGIAKIVDWMRASWISIPDVVLMTITDKKYEAGLRTAALEMIHAAEATNGPPVGHIYDDLYSAFRASGVSASEAEEFTWNVLAVIATSGPNLQYRLENIDIPGDSMQSKVALAAISIVLPLLDFRSFSSGKPYSYPKELKSHCDSGKPYHFWMSAYFARRLAPILGDEESAAAAAFILEKGYQMRADGGWRDPTVAFTSAPLSASNTALRVDLAYAAAGTRFGVDTMSRNPAHELDVDQAIRKVIADAQYVHPVATAEEAKKLWDGRGVEGYFRWSKIFAPNTALRAFF